MVRWSLWLAGWFVVVAVPAFAQLTDETQTFPSVPGGQIGKSLEEQIGAGQGDAFTPGSSIYLIRRDPARSIRRGRQLFQRKFTAAQGVGPRVNAEGTGDIRENRALGAGLSDSCAGCHGRPRGSAGFGGDVVTRPDSRDAPHLFGLGLKEMLADEMTAELRAHEQAAVEEAAARGRSVTRTLRAKGVAFGRLTALPDGQVDTSEVEGVDPDLRIRPFFLHGETISIREFVVGAFQAEMGLQTADPVLCGVTDPDAPVAATSPAGFAFDPARDRFERPPICDGREDGDGDGVVEEVDPALLDHMEMYLLNYFKPGLDRQTRRTRQGRVLMDRLGCTSCHVDTLTVERDRRVADVETRYDPRRGLFNALFAVAEERFVVVEDGDPYPRLDPAGDSFAVEHLFTDFKRHDLGPTFWEREYDGTVQKEFLTPALWGVGSTGPYGHDGRSMTLRNVILRHGGEAARSSRAFARLRDTDQRKVLEFLQSLVLFPPDDTSSSLKPARRGSADVQDPDVHGSIDLGALFQISAEGPE